MTEPNHSRLERLAFSGKGEDFAAFCEQFEARMHVLTLGDYLDDKLKVPAVQTQETAVETTVRDQGEEEKKRQRFMVWREPVRCLDKGSINFIRLSRADGVAAWRALQGKHLSINRPRIADPSDHVDDQLWGTHQ